IKSRMFHGRFLLLGLGQTLKRGKHHRNHQSFERGSKHQVETSKITSSSTGAPSGRLATPYTKRQGFLSFPKTSCSNSEAPSATFGCSRTSPEVATATPSRTIRVNLSSDPKCSRATARALSAAR